MRQPFVSSFRHRRIGSGARRVTTGTTWRRLVRAALCGALGLASPLGAQVGAASPAAVVSGPGGAPSAETWRRIGADARALVAAESPAAALPFAAARSGSPGGFVFAHYFPPFPLSIDNAPTHRDYYARQYLQPGGENGKFRTQRGFLRERPLAVAVQAASRLNPVNLSIEVARAARIGIDAFGVDLLSIAPGNGAREAALTLLDAAQAAAPGFRIVPEPDMTSLGKVTVAALADELGLFARHPAGYRLADGRLLVVPFAANAQPPAFWRALIAAMAARRAPIALAPDYVDTSKLGELASIAWGATIWGTRDSKAGERQLAYQREARALGVRNWIAPVAPQDYRPKDGLITEARNSEAFRNQWTSAIAGGAKAVHLITWNDYSESSEVSPSSFSQFVWYDLAAYYIAWLKRGAPPPIARDALYYVQRSQIVRPDDAQRGPVQTVVGGAPLANDVELVAFLTAPGRLTIRIGGQTISRDVGAGLQTLRMAAAPGRPDFRLSRGGRTILDKASDWPIEAAPSRHDATYGGGSTTRPLIRIPALAPSAP